MNDIPTRPSQGRTRLRIGMGLTWFGFLTFLIGADPGLFRLDRSPVTGFVQISVFLIGLAIICLGGYVCLAALWNSYEKTIVADIGLRLVSTGYVIAFASGMADVIGFGNEHLPQVPVFGVWQRMGVMIGEIVIAIGFLMLIPFRKPKHKEIVEL
jgi:hypothetical protein